MAGDRNVVIRLRGEIGDFQAKMVAAGKSVAGVADKMTGAEKEGAKFRRGLDQLGSTAGKIGLVAGAGVAAAVAAAANFDQAMSNVRAATHETADNMDALREAAIRAGADTAFSASEAASGIENLAKAGVQTADILNGGLQGALDLAAAGTIDVGEAAETAATALTQFGLSGEDVPHVADLLAAAAGKAQGEVTDMAYALKQSGLVADQVGLSIEETTGGLAAFASAGLLGSDAGTSFKTMLGALTPNSEKAAKAMEALGIHAYDANGNFIGLAEVAGNLRTALGDMTTEQRQATLETIFGSDAVRAASVLYEQGADGIQSWIDKVNDQGYAAETAAIKLDNLKGDLEAFKGSLETALIGAGDGSQGPLRSLVQGATDVVNAFNDLPDSAKSVATAFAGITAVTGGGLWFGSKVIQGIAGTREALTNLGVSAETSTKAMKGAAAAGAGLAALGVAIGAVRALNAALDESLPGTEALTANLLNIQDQGLAYEFDSISESIKRITDPSFSQGFADWMPNFGFQDPKSLREARAEIDALDQAFSNIASSGSPQQAMDAFRNFADTTGLTVSQQRDLLDQMPQLSETFAGAANSATLAGDAVGGAADGMGDLGSAAAGAAQEVNTLDDAMDALFGKTDIDAALVAWKRGLADLKGAVKDNAKTLDVNTKAGQDNRDAIRGNVDDLRSWAEAVYEQTGSVKGLERRLLKGREAILKQAEAAGFSKKETEAYLKELGLTPKEIRTDVRLIGAPKAGEQIDDLIYKAKILKGELKAMSKTRIDIRSRGTGALDGYASGGYTGDVPVHAVAGVVHGQEFVVNARATAQNRALLEAINRGVPGYRNGGYVTAQSSTTNYYNSGTSIDYDRLAAAMSKARPLYGPVTVRDGSDFLRTLEADQRREAMGGVNFGG